ncbi:hypothetical protein L208DRAFT_1399397 [Tricholoma matsutake]|nr:hypothetical protein L208DRAFT_1399397 [Tricholoma matsutake 945]
MQLQDLLPWQDVTAVVVVFALWRFLVVFTRRSVLDDIKGPPGAKFVEGQSTHRAGAY